MKHIGFISLPFQPRKEIKTPFYFTTSIIGEYLSSIFNGTYYLGINLLHSFQIYNNKDIQMFEKMFDFIEKKRIYYDSCFVDKVLSVIRQLYSTGDICIHNESVARCSCGRVEIAYYGKEALNENNRCFHLVEERDGKLICKHCNSELMVEEKEGLYLCFNENILKRKINIYPQYLEADFNHLKKMMNKSKLRISRERTTGVSIILGGKEFNVDVDTIWQLHYSQGSRHVF